VRSSASTRCFGLRKPWPLARVANEQRVDAAAFQRHVQLFGLCDVNVVIKFAVNEHRRRLHLAHVA